MTAPVRLRFGKPGAPGEFVIDLAKAEVFRGETPLRLQQQPFRLLAALVERPGDVLTRAELSERLWGAGTFVDAEAGINTAIAKLRDALGDTAEMPEIVQTVPRRGYRFVATVSAAEENVPAQEPRSRLFRIAVRVLAAGAAVLPVLAAVAIWHAPRAKVPIAVILFDNETDRPEWDRLAQSLTDSTVLRLTAEPLFEVIGNAPELRTPRPFQDLRLVRDRVGARFIVIGQLQRSGDGFRVMAHLIRAADLVHLWAEAIPISADPPRAGDDQVADRIVGAVLTKAR